MKLYLRPIGDETTYNNAANYPDGMPWAAPAGWEWIDGDPPVTATAYQEKSLNQVLEEAFLTVLPNHVGQPYLTSAVLLSIATTKQAITDFNKLGQYILSKAMIAGLSLPAEMEADRQALLALYPEA